MIDGRSASRYGVIGTGMMGVEHIENILALDGATVTAFADPNEGSRDAARRAMAGRPPAAEFEGHRALLDADLCDVVVVASPNHTHRDVLIDVLGYPVHVLVEKPLCTTIEDCREVLDAAAGDPPSGMDHRVVWMGLEYRYMPPTRRLMDELDAGSVGEVKMVSVREHRFPFLPKVDDWNRFNRNTGGTLVEKCCHFFDLMNQVAGSRPRRVYASGAQSVNHLDELYEGRRPDILDNAFVIVDYDNGVRGSLDLCMFADASKNEQELTVVGDAGKVEAFTTESLLRVGRRADGLHAVVDVLVEDPEIRHSGMHHGSSYLEHVDLATAVATGGPPLVTLLDGLWAVAIGAAAHRSIDEARPVDLDEFAELKDLEFVS
jgi:predicted dehydrogenase